MAKINLPNPNNTSLDPFKSEKEILNQLNIKPTQQVNPYVGMGDSQLADTFSGANLREGYSLLGDEQKAIQTALNTDIEDQTVLGNVAKGVGRTIGKAATEILKTPGYIGGLVMAADNEIRGDGKNSMSLAVDNAWINAFESLDQNIKDFMPVHIQQEVQEGGLWGKMSDSSWWASTGADGLGFMLSMFAPGAITKAMGVGKGAAVLSEVLANTKIGKGIRSLGKFTTASEELFDTVGLYKYNTNLARNLDGVSSALVNTTLEAASEAAGTFDNSYKELKEKVKSGEMSDEKAREIAGQKASSVFKSNLALLAVSNVLEEAWIWKQFGFKQPSIIDDAITAGKIDFNKLSQITKKSYSDLVKNYGSGFAKNAAKEGIFEEGLQTQIEQNAEKGKDGVITATQDLLSQIFGGVFKGEDEFWNNSELHESMFLGAVLGGGMGTIGQYKENKNLERILNGYTNPVVQTPLQKMASKLGFSSLKQETKGFANMIQDNWLNNFKSNYSNLLTEGKLDESKVLEALKNNQKEQVLHTLYDVATQSGNKEEARRLGNYIAHNYVQPFLGQPGMEKVFEDHVKNQVTEEWANRFEQYAQRPATEQEIKDFQDSFIESGNNVFRAYKEVEQTNYPERYFQPKDATPQQYSQFRKDYFQQRLKLLLDYSSLQQELESFESNLSFKHKIHQDETGRYVPNDKLDFLESQKLAAYNLKKAKVEKEKKEIQDQYEALQSKKGVEEFYNASRAVGETTQKIKEELAKDKVKLEQQKELVEKDIQEKTEQISKEPSILVTPTGVKPVTVVQKEISNNPEDVSTDTIMQKNNGTVIVDEDGNEIETIDLFTSTVKPQSDLQVETAIQDQTKVEVVTESTPDIEESINRYEEFAELGKLSETDRTSTGRHIEYNFFNNQYTDVLTPEGLPVLGTPDQQKWQNHLNKLNGSNYIKVVSIKTLREKYPDIYNEISLVGRDLQDNDKWVILMDNNGFVNDNGFVFTSMYRPDTMYQKENLRVAEKYIIDKYEAYSKEPVPDDVSGIREYKDKAFEFSKNEYRNWYDKTDDVDFEIGEVTNGHLLVRKDKDGNIMWNNAFDNLPENGTLEILKTNGRIFKGRTYNFKKGDILYVTPDSIFPLKARNLNNEEVDVILKLIERLDGSPINSHIFEQPIPINQIQTEENVGIFYDETRPSVLSMLINTGSKTFDIKPDGVYINEQKVTPAELKPYLLTLRKNITTLTSAKFELQDNSIKVSLQSKQDVLKNDLLTMSVREKGYPYMLQRNIVLGNEIEKISEQVVPQKSRRELLKEKASQAAKDFDKIYSPDEILQIKINSGEIKQYCK